MPIKFHVVDVGGSVQEENNTAYLWSNNWDDFGFKTTFYLSFCDSNGRSYNIGSLKIGFSDQSEGWTKEHMPTSFKTLPSSFFSLGQDVDYYSEIMECLDKSSVSELLSALGDVVFDERNYTKASNSAVFHESLLRSVTVTSVKTQFKRVLDGGAPLTVFDFLYKKEADANCSEIILDFCVNPDQKPSSNIHVLIGRNGVGKTTILNNMVSSLISYDTEKNLGEFYSKSIVKGVRPLPSNYFAGVVSVSFSVFDPFIPPREHTEMPNGMNYSYVGLKKREGGLENEQVSIKNIDDLCKEFTDSLSLCLALDGKRERWKSAIKMLESDLNFSEMELLHLVDKYNENSTGDKRNFLIESFDLFGRMSSGHAIVILTITRLVEVVEEKTLVVLDEPESHLHPPLLSAFIRAISDLLTYRNGVAIVATHSPVILQELPKSCVSILQRNRSLMSIDRPEVETFGENVGVLSRDVFGLEVSRSGFHGLLSSSVEGGGSFEDIEREYSYELGFEGRAILKTMILHRDASNRDVR